VLLLVGSLVAAHALFAVFPAVFESWNAQAFDRLFALRSRSAGFQPHYDDTIVHADINNSSLQEIGDFYLNRAHFARAVRALGQMGLQLSYMTSFLRSTKKREEDEP